jgi:hypothetical protein
MLLWATLAGGTQPYATYESAVAADGPVAQYRFDDAVGSSTLADSVGTFTGSNSGIVLGGEGPFGGSKSGAFGGEAFATLPSDPLAGATAFTAEAWVDWAGAKCPAGRSHVIVADAQAEVYVGGVGGSFREPSFLGCAYARGKSYELGVPEGTGGGAPNSVVVGSKLYTLAGPIVAFEESSVTELEPASRYIEQIVIRNLRDGQLIRRLPTGTPVAPPKNPEDAGIGEATAIVVKRDGAVAWIVEVDDAAVEYQVHAFDKAGNHVLASGSDIEPHSLALVGNTLYWLQAGKPMSAALN